MQEGNIQGTAQCMPLPPQRLLPTTRPPSSGHPAGLPKMANRGPRDSSCARQPLLLTTQVSILVASLISTIFEQRSRLATTGAAHTLRTPGRAAQEWWAVVGRCRRLLHRRHTLRCCTTTAVPRRWGPSPRPPPRTQLSAGLCSLLSGCYSQSA